MIGLDTRVLVRYLAEDDEAQAAGATHFIETQLSERRPGFISRVALVERCWVLQRLDAATAAESAQMATDLLATPRFRLQGREAVQDAVQALRCATTGGAGLTDVLIAHIALREGRGAVVGFDRAAIRLAGMTAVGPIAGD